MSVYQISSYEVLGNFVKEINKMWNEGKDPLVTIQDKREDRSKAQNRLMHMWFRDIAKSTKHGIVYEAGRCKYQYFLPILAMSEREDAIIASFVAKETEKRVGYERFLKVLGSSVIGTTRFLTVKEFEEALTAMQFGEAEHNLTNPELHGYRWVHDSKRN